MHFGVSSSCLASEFQRTWLWRDPSISRRCFAAPFFGDQILNALRFEELGCGFSQSFHADLKSVKGWSPDLGLISPEGLAAAMHRLLEEPRFQEAAAAVRARQEAEIGL